MGTDKHLKLRATPNSALGLVISHLQNGLTNQQELAAATLLARFLPFVMEPDDPQFRSVAIRCANECEAWGRIIREYAELGVPSSVATIPMMGQLDRPVRDSVAYSDEHDDVCEPEEELDPELEERKGQRRKNPMGF